MHSAIYSAAPKDSSFNSEKKIKYVVIKASDSNPFKHLIKDNKPTVEIINEHKFKNSEKYLFVFEVKKSLSNNLKAYLNKMLEPFLEENNNLKQESNNFIKLLEVDGEYNFKRLDVNENLTEEIIPEKLAALRMNSNAVSSHNLLDAERENSQSSAPSISISSLNRPNSLIEAKYENETLRRTLSFHDNPVNKESISVEQPESLASSQDSIENQSGYVDLESVQLVQKVQSFFSLQNDSLSKISDHGLAIQEGSYNAKAKSEILLDISNLAAEIKYANSHLIDNSSNKEDVKKLKKDISDLNSIINNERNIDILSRYRGFSPFKCFATLWGGGKVKSIEYVEQIREQVANLNQEITALRPTV